MQVAPLATALPSENERSDRMPKALGLLWLWLVLVPSFYYLTLLQPHLANDLFWPNYNASGYQIFVIDLLNALLESTPDASTVDLSLEMVDARYDGVLPNAMVHPTYAMALLTTSRSSLEGAIISLRNTSLNSVHWLPTQYCWIDFDKTFELAYTESRQKRCSRRYAANGAVYLEAVYRNMDWSAYVAKYGSRNSNLWWAILRGLESSQRGVDWMKTVASVSTLVPAEVVYWQRAGIEVFHYQWQSVELPGLVETATLLNALGIPTSLTLKSIEHSQGPGLSISFYESFLLGIWMAGSSNASLIRGSSDYFLNLGAPSPSLESSSYGFNMFGAHQVSLVHSTLGPFLSIDLLVLSPPVALVSLTKSVSAALYESLNSASPTTYATLRTLTVAPIPPAWKQYVYYGGNLMCSYDTPQTFLQPPFTTTDACDVQTLWTVSVAPLAMVSALSLVSDSSESICALGTSDACTPFLQQAQTLALRTLDQTLVQDAVTAVRALDVSVIQAASDVTETNYTLLRQPLLDPSSFAFYGWVLLFDWVVGVREVVSFEGDNGTLVLISDDYDTTAQTSPASSVLSRASITVYYLVVYSTLVLGALVLVCTVGLCSHRRPVHRASIAYFYRVASSTWLGRPLVLLRGTTAMLLLSSAPIALSRSHNLFTQLELPRRLLLETLVLSWEATWVSYVLQELLLPLTRHGAREAGILSTALLGCSCIVLDVVWPVSVVVSINRSCVAQDIATMQAYVIQIHCHSCTMALGSPGRLLVLAALGGCAALVSIAFFHRYNDHRREGSRSLLVPGVAVAFFDQNSHDKRSVDDICMGLLPWRHGTLFDIKLWTLIHPASEEFSSVKRMSRDVLFAKQGFVWLVAGAIYVGLDIGSSISYLQVLEMTLSNDLIWLAFNMTGTHVFLANWMLTSSSALALYTMDSSWVNQLGVFNTTAASIGFPIQQGARVQYSTLTTLSDTISGLRTLDGCDGPWVFTQYCYLDFDQKWDMANSAKRQERCKSLVSNGAVFLASLLRNVDISTCWNEEFEIGFGSELRESMAGQALLASFTPPYLSIDDEVSYWTLRNISSYTLQWQNYKSIGLVNSYNIVNAYGISYPFMLQATAGYHRLESQTSFKMYWSLASDLGALLKNTSTISGKSLLRSSSRFAFQNTSLQDILVTEKVLPPWPWSANYELLSSYLGPFGSIDMVYVSVPSVLSEAISAFDVAVAGARKLATSSYVLIRDEYYTFPAPALWAKTVYAASGSVLCPDQPSAYLAKLTLILGADAYQKGCEALYHTALSMVSSRDHILFSVLVAGIDATTNVTAICLLEPLSNIPYCETKLHTAMAFLLHVPDLTHWRPSLYAAIHELQIQWVQFGALNTTAPMELYHLPVLDPSDATFDYVAWLFLYDWALGNREVISFQGDLGTLTAMGSDLPHLEQTDDAAQLPTVLALYARRAVQYVTVSIIALAVLSLIYLIRVRGAIEGRNLLKLSRVGGLVWVGRPLIGLRSITALALLSSASVQLRTDGQLSYFTSQAVPWYTTCLAANEVTWLVGIVNDLGLPWTTWHLPKYALINSLLVWLVSALLAILAPVQASISIAKSCAVVSLDYQVQCSAGAVLIGSRARLLTLIGVVFGCNVLCYSVARWYYQDDSRLRSSSLLLCSGAKFLFRHETWIKHDVYYMDRASAVVNGLVSVGWRDEWFVMDVKTWRLHRLSNGGTRDPRLCRALPLVNGDSRRNEIALET